MSASQPWEAKTAPLLLFSTNPTCHEINRCYPKQNWSHRTLPLPSFASSQNNSLNHSRCALKSLPTSPLAPTDFRSGPTRHHGSRHEQESKKSSEPLSDDVSISLYVGTTPQWIAKQKDTNQSYKYTKSLSIFLQLHYLFLLAHLHPHGARMVPGPSTSTTTLSWPLLAGLHRTDVHSSGNWTVWGFNKLWNLTLPASLLVFEPCVSDKESAKHPVWGWEEQASYPEAFKKETEE